MRRRVWLIYVTVLTAAMPVYFLAAHGSSRRTLFYGYGLASIAGILVGVRLHRPQRRLPWVAFAVGLSLFLLGDFVFNIYTSGGHELPFPSIADLVYLCAYPAVAFGLAQLVRTRTGVGRLAGTLDGLIVALGGGVVAWVFVMAPYASDSSLSIEARVVSIAYPALDVLLLAMLAHLLLGVRSRPPSYWLLATSVASLLIADAFFAVGTLHGTYKDGSLIDLGWIASYMLWGAAALHPSMREVTEPPRLKELGSGRASMAVLTLAALATPTVIIVQKARGKSVDVALLAAASALMFLLVLARVGLLTRAVHSLYGQLWRAEAAQRVLTDAAVAFVGAPDADAIQESAVRAAATLVSGPDAWSSFVTMSPGGLVVAAAAGAAAGRKGRPADPAAQEDHFSAPVYVNGDVRGTLGAGPRVETTAESLPALMLLASQMGLALQATEATQERLRSRNERRFSSLVEHSADVVTIVGADRLIQYRSPGARVMFGQRPEDLVGTRLGGLVHPDDRRTVEAVFDRVFAGDLGYSTSVECRVAHTDGSWRTVEITTTNLLDDPDVGGVVLNSRDVTERRALERDLEHQAFHDVLSGLANRALFGDRVSHALSRADRDGFPVAVLFLDLYDFKTVNDSLGHPAGDEVLVGVAGRLETEIRPGDTVARLGGDEFAVLLEYGVMPDDAQRVALRIGNALETPFVIGAGEVTVQASVGLAVGWPGRDSADELLMHADLAMYMAKRSGKGRVALYEPSMHDEAVRRLEIVADLRRGLAAGQFEVYYQPIVNVANGTVAGAEALVRWHHPTRGLVSPVDFIPVAESTGLVVPLDRWVLAEACRQVEVWREAGVLGPDFYVSVNLSTRQLQSGGLADEVTKALRDSGLPPACLVLEVTESAVMENFDTAIARLAELKALGLRLAVDDFGTGYSSLSYLRNLPVDVIKIDKSFIDRLTQDSAGAAMVRSVIDLGRALNLTSIAEGVEHADQLALLEQFGCERVQGFLFSEPVPGSEIPTVIAGLHDGARPSVAPVSR